MTAGGAGSGHARGHARRPGRPHLGEFIGVVAPTAVLSVNQGPERRRRAAEGRDSQDCGAPRGPAHGRRGLPDARSATRRPRDAHAGADPAGRPSPTGTSRRRASTGSTTPTSAAWSSSAVTSRSGCGSAAHGRALAAGAAAGRRPRACGCSSTARSSRCCDDALADTAGLLRAPPYLTLLERDADGRRCGSRASAASAPLPRRPPAAAGRRPARARRWPSAGVSATAEAPLEGRARHVGAARGAAGPTSTRSTRTQRQLLQGWPTCWRGAACASSASTPPSCGPCTTRSPGCRPGRCCSTGSTTPWRRSRPRRPARSRVLLLDLDRFKEVNDRLRARRGRRRAGRSSGRGSPACVRPGDTAARLRRRRVRRALRGRRRPGRRATTCVDAAARGVRRAVPRPRRRPARARRQHRRRVLGRARPRPRRPCCTPPTSRCTATSGPRLRATAEARWSSCPLAPRPPGGARRAGLHRPAPTGAPDRRHLRRVLRRTLLLQIDSVNVLERAHYLPVFSRLGPVRQGAGRPRGVRPRRELFEYWGHEASLLPVALHPLLRWRMERARAARGGLGRAAARVRERPELVAPGARAGARARARWAPARCARGRAGGLVVGLGRGQGGAGAPVLGGRGHHRTAGAGFERLYDLTERVLPAARARPAHADAGGRPARAGAAVGRRAGRRAPRGACATTSGCAREADAAAAATWSRRASCCRSTVEGRPWYLHRRRRPAAAAGAAQRAAQPVRPAGLGAHPDRGAVRLPLPASRSTSRRTKRVHGYYVLPFLHDEALAARVDLKADRAGPGAAGAGGVRRARRGPDGSPHALARELRAAGRLAGARRRRRRAAR